MEEQAKKERGSASPVSEDPDSFEDKAPNNDGTNNEQNNELAVQNETATDDRNATNDEMNNNELNAGDEPKEDSNDNSANIGSAVTQTIKNKSGDNELINKESGPSKADSAQNQKNDSQRIDPLTGKLKGTRINKMVMNGFKSFARHTEFLFAGDYNCVIGPNGSGKSNVLDALCFVLGKSSSKSLRAEKSANLIYNGGKAKKPSKQGEVSIFFSNDQKIFPTPEKEVKLTRIVRSNGQSIYKINDEARTRQEILDLLSMAKINPDGYNIILQGDIIKLVEMHPNERRQLIGEIAGITIYDEKKEKALRELQKVDERLKETEIVLVERNTYLKELKKDRDHALKYKEMNDSIKKNTASHLKKQIDRKNLEKQELDRHMGSAKSELDSINEKIRAFKDENLKRREEIDEITREIETKGEIEQVKLNKEVEFLKIDLAKKQSRQEQLKTEIGKLEHRKQDLRQGISEIEEKVRQIDAEKKAMEAEILSKKQEHMLISQKIAQFKQKNNLDNLGEIEKQIGDIDKKAEELQKEVQETREQQHNLIREMDKIAIEKSNIDLQLEKVSAVEREQQKQIDVLNHQRSEFKKCTSELNKKLEEDALNAAKLSEKRKAIAIAQEDLSKLKARQLSAQELSHADVALKKIVEMKKSSPKIYGTVAELGNVDSKYALALEIAAGPKIKSVVVDDDRTAAECIKLLKERKLGVVTFLPLNKISGRSAEKAAAKLKDAKGVQGFAIDLVSFDPRFKDVFEYVLADTVIVDTIDAARRLGIGSAKFVTLEGDMAERSGAMIGGYRLARKHSLGFSERDIAEEVAKREEEYADLHHLIDILEKRRIDDEETISRLRTTKAQLEGEIIKAEKSLNLNKDENLDSRQRRQLLQKQEQETDEKIRLVQDKISTLNRELAMSKMEKEKLRQSIAQLRNPRLIAELNAFEEKMSELNSHLIKIDSEIKLRDAQAENIYKSELNRTHKIINEIEKDTDQFSRELNDLDALMKEKAEDLRKKEAVAQEFYAKFRGLFLKRAQIDKAIQENESKIMALHEKSRACEIKANTHSLKLADMNAILAGLQHEFSQYEGIPLDLEKTEEELKNEIRKFERMRDSIGSVNMRALEIYDDVETQYRSLLEKKDSLDSEKTDVLKLMEEIEGRKKELFMKTYSEVNERFKQFFTKLTTKGAQAALVLENEQEPFEEGVRINVKITGSKFLDIRSLSGGEKTMTALAFIFAIQEYEPASFYVLDEVDAALDKHNSEKLSKLIAEYSRSAQYVVISHNDAVISEADILYGVSMNEHGMSQVVSLKV